MKTRSLKPCGRWGRALMPFLLVVAMARFDALPARGQNAGGVDYGDAPAPYPTLKQANGAAHALNGELFLGKRADAEPDGQPGVNATGDDTSPLGAVSDEDGIKLLEPLVPGKTVQVEVTVVGKGRLFAWMDFNLDGDWADAGERIFNGLELAPGTQVLSFPVSTVAKLGSSYARFRITTSADAGFAGALPDGEVEDYRVEFVKDMPKLDLGDAPGKYPTLMANGGASHLITLGLALGNIVDGEVDGQPTLDALGDDKSPVGTSDDEDGVVFLGALVQGQPTGLKVTATVLSGTAPGKAMLDAWVDFNGNESWGDPGEQVLASVPVSHGENVLTIVVPAGAKPGATYARFRLSRKGQLGPGGAAEDGEVEDYLVGIESQALMLDLGDAPGKYPTLLANDGARHVVVQGLALGTRVDVEPDGQPALDALGDDKNPRLEDDEDGVVFESGLVGGTDATVKVTVTALAGTAPGKALLDAWVDFNGNESWGDPGEKVFASISVTHGVNVLTFPVPAGAMPGATYARFRLSREGQLGPGGAAEDGEVEDYLVGIEANAVSLDMGDAPGKYPTLLANDGARHVIVQGLALGELVDGEKDGQPAVDAEGDDLAPIQMDDEDGVTFVTGLVMGQAATVHVTVRAPGGRAFLDAWVDFDGNESWGDVGEQVFTSQPVIQGLNVLSFPVPGNLRPGMSFARFRLSLTGRLAPGGASDAGEVEDYAVKIEPAEVAMDFGDAPGKYPTLLADDGARHGFNEAFRLGQVLDVEADGRPEPALLGDDAIPEGAPDDEDGVVFLTPLVPGREAVVRVYTPSQRTFLNAWVDFGGDESWAQAGDQVAAAFPLSAGNNDIRFLVPPNARPGVTASRFRLSTVERLDFKGAAPDGEVEDHRARILAEEERCDLSCAGRDFWLTFPGNYAPDPDNPPVASLAIQGVPGTTVEVSQPGTGFVASLVIPPSATLNVVLPRQAELGELNDEVKPLGVRVRASDEVIVAGFNHARYSTDSFRAMHVAALGRRYMVMAAPNVQSGAPSLNGSEFAIVGVRPDTTVTITPTVSSGSRTAGVPYSVVLNAGDVYQLRATGDAPADVTGTVIQSDQPVAVFGGHRCANVPGPGVWFCDHVVEQLPQVNNWGVDFMLAPFAGRTGGDWVRVLAAADGTAVAVDGVPVAVLGKGQVHALALGAGARIQSSRPVLVAQFARSADADPVATTQGDPFMLLVQGTRHYQAGYVLETPATGFATNFIHLTVPNPAVGGVMIDGVAVPAGAYTAIGGSGHAFARIPVAPGLHRVSGGLPFGACLYGWGEHDSYGHPGCFFAGDIQPPQIAAGFTSLTVAVDEGQAQAGKAPVPSLTAAVKLEDNCSPQTRTPEQFPPPGLYLPVGSHVITLTVADDSGNESEAEFLFNVIDPSPVTIECPQDILVPCQTPEGAIVEFAIKAYSKYNPNVRVFTMPESGSLFPPGVTEVNATAVGSDGKEVVCTFRVIVDCERKVVVGPTSIQDGQLKLEWADPNGTLEEAPTPAGPWVPVIKGVSNYSVRIEGPERYFRIRY